MLLGALSSCIEYFEPEIPADESAMLVVNGSIRSGEKSVFVLSRTVTLGEKVPDPYVHDATVAVCGTDGMRYKAKQNGNKYEVWVGRLASNEQYWVEIVTPDGTAYSSEPMSPVDAPDMVGHYSQLGKNSPVEFTIDTYPTDEPTYVSLNYDETWEVKTPYIPTHEYYPREKKIFATAKPHVRGWGMSESTATIIEPTSKYVNHSIKGYKIHEVSSYDTRIYLLYRIRMYVEAVSKEEYEYEEARRKQTDEMGGLFTPQPTQLPSNIHSVNSDRKAIGYVGVRGKISSYTIMLTRKEVEYNEVRKMEILSPGEIKKLGYNNAMLHDLDYSVLDFDVMANGYNWISTWAVDCRHYTWKTQTETMPDDWPDLY